MLDRRSAGDAGKAFDGDGLFPDRGHGLITCGGR
jgi:hypothetical protein